MKKTLARQLRRLADRLDANNGAIEVNITGGMSAAACALALRMSDYRRGRTQYV